MRTRKEAADVPQFGSAQPKPEQVKVSPDLARVVEKVFLKENMDLVYNEVEDSFRVGEGRNERGILTEALDNSIPIARKAFSLMITAKLEREKFEIENEVYFCELRTKATESLEEDKKLGKRTKMITDADIISRMAYLDPDRYRDQESNRRKLELTVKSLEHMVTMSGEKCSELQIQVSKQR